MNIIIRQYSATDLTAVLNSWERATRLAHSFMTDDFIKQERKKVADLYLPNTDTWVAEVDGSVQGFISLMGNEVGAIFLEPSFHGKGIGKALMNKACELYDELEVEVFKANKIGRSFYSKFGFKYIDEKFHGPTAQQVLRMIYATKNR